MISQNELYNKLQFAKIKYHEYSLQITERYATGNINKSIPLKLSVISSWLKYLDKRITNVVSINSKDPAPIVLNNIYLNLRSNISSPIEVIYITDIYNRTIPISKFTVQDNLSSNLLIQRILQGRNNVSYHHYNANFINLSYGTADNSIKVIFNNVGSNFNGKIIKAAANIVNFISGQVTSGSNAVNEGTPISYDLISKYNTILDTIAVDLNFAYKNIDSNYSNSINITSFQSGIENTAISDEDNKYISDEHGNTLTFE